MRTCCEVSGLSHRQTAPTVDIFSWLPLAREARASMTKQKPRPAKVKLGTAKDKTPLN